MQKLDSVPFLILLLEAAQRFEALAEESRTPLQAAKIACSVGLVPTNVIGLNDDIVQAIIFFGSAKKYKNISLNVISLMARLQEERARASYEKLYAQRAA